MVDKPAFFFLPVSRTDLWTIIHVLNVQLERYHVVVGLLSSHTALRTPDKLVKIRW